MASSSPCLYLKLLSANKSLHLSPSLSPLPHSPHTNKLLNLSISLSSSSSSSAAAAAASSSTGRPLRPLSLSSSSSSSSSHTQTEVDTHELLLQESPNGHTIEAETQTVRVQFQLQRECSFGHNFLLTGDHPILGLWDPNNAISLTWSDGHIWTVALDIPVGICIKFKLLLQETSDKFVWQPGPDRIFQCFHTQKMITLCEDWENPDSRIIIQADPTEIPSQEPEEYEINMQDVLVSDEGVPVLVPGLSQMPVDEAPNHEPEELVNEAATVSAGPDMAKDLTLPEFDSKSDIANTLNSNPRPEISSIHENQESCENKYQEMQVVEEQDHQATQPMRSLLQNDIQWSNNVMQKFLNIFGLQ